MFDLESFFGLVGTFLVADSWLDFVLCGIALDFVCFACFALLGVAFVLVLDSAVFFDLCIEVLLDSLLESIW